MTTVLPEAEKWLSLVESKHDVNYSANAQLRHEMQLNKAWRQYDTICMIQ